MTRSPTDPLPYAMPNSTVALASMPAAERQRAVAKMDLFAGLEVEADLRNLLAWRADPAAYEAWSARIDAGVDAADGVSSSDRVSP